MKYRLYHASLGAPEITVADNDAVTQQHGHALESHTLDVVSVVAYEHLPDMIRIVEEHGGGCTLEWLYCHKVTKLASPPIQLVEGDTVYVDIEGLGGARCID